MKRLITNYAAIAICAVAAFFLTSCIYDSAGDNALVTFIDGWRGRSPQSSDSNPATSIRIRMIFISSDPYSL